MKIEDIGQMVQRANEVKETSRAAAIVELDETGEMHLATYGTPMGILTLRVKLRNFMKNE